MGEHHYVRGRRQTGREPATSFFVCVCVCGTNHPAAEKNGKVLNFVFFSPHLHCKIFGWVRPQSVSIVKILKGRKSLWLLSFGFLLLCSRVLGDKWCQRSVDTHHAGQMMSFVHHCSRYSFVKAASVRLHSTLTWRRRRWTAPLNPHSRDSSYNMRL